MNIDSINNGIVIDHIEAGKAMEIYNYLGVLEKTYMLDFEIKILEIYMKHKFIDKNTIHYLLEDKDDIISTSNLLIYSCVYLFSISISLHSYKRMLN